MTNTLPGTGYRVDLSPGIYSELWCSEYDTDDGSHEGHHAFALALEAAPRIGRSQRHRLTIASAPFSSIAK